MARRDLDGIALVTGGTGGVGEALCRQLADAGMKAVTLDLPGKGADLDADVTDLDAMRAAVERVVDEHGRLDVVVANAGIATGGLVETLPPEAWTRTLRVGVDGAVNTVLAAYPVLIERGRGHLVFMSSLAGLVPLPLLVPYATAKHAVVGLATSLRPEAARHGVGVTVVCPGPIDTPFLDTGGAAEMVQGVGARRYLTSAAGPALTADAVAAATLKGIRKDRAIVAPGRARSLSTASRFAPRLVGRIIAGNMRKELAAQEV